MNSKQIAILSEGIALIASETWQIIQPAQINDWVKRAKVVLDEATEPTDPIIVQRLEILEAIVTERRYQLKKEIDEAPTKGNGA